MSHAVVSYSSHHLSAAVLLSRASRGLESSASGDDDAVGHYASATVMSAVAFLEATINQLFCEGVTAPLPWHPKKSKRAFRRMGELWPSIESQPVLDKYQTALTIFDKPK